MGLLIPICGIKFMYPIEIQYSHLYILFFSLILSPNRKLGTVYELNSISVAFPLAFGTAQTGPMKHAPKCLSVGST